MNMQDSLRLAAILALSFVAAACDGADDTVGGSTAQVPQQAVTEAARQVPMALLAADLTTRSVALTSSGQCSDAVDLGGGLTANCVPFQNGVSFWVTGSPTSAPSCQVEIGINAFPGQGDAYEFTAQALESYIGCNQTNHYLAANGSVTADASGSVQSASATMELLDRTWHSTAQSLMLEQPSAGFSLTLDFGTGTGPVKQNGSTVATLTVSGGCTTVNFLDATLTDSTVCAW
ncbi:MAG TPA: hypothetical protein VF139_11825 [Candidatus Polarisedimenticolaceae bacterium]